MQGAEVVDVTDGQAAGVQLHGLGRGVWLVDDGGRSAGAVGHGLGAVVGEVFASRRRDPFSSEHLKVELDL